jgi:hypothetical protein
LTIIDALSKRDDEVARSHSLNANASVPPE